MSQLGNLDTESAASVIKLLSEVAKDKLVIIVTHNYEQVERFATRKIKMHDGRIIEDKVLKDIENVEKNKTVINIKNIGIFNQIRLGVRNTFNILGKFILLFLVFLFITISIISEYTSFKEQEHLLSTYGYNYNFEDISSNRIIIKKNNNSEILEEDYKALADLPNVDYIVKNDLLLDTGIELTNNNNIYLYCSIASKPYSETTVDIGRLPENDNEIIIEGNSRILLFKRNEGRTDER